MAHLTRPVVLSAVSAGSFPETAAGNGAYIRGGSRIFLIRECTLKKCLNLRLGEGGGKCPPPAPLP